MTRSTIPSFINPDLHNHLAKLTVALLIACLLSACIQKQTSDGDPLADIKNTLKHDSVRPPKNEQKNVPDSVEEEYANFYIVIADTGTNYRMLWNKMMVLHQQNSLEIDSMGRYYDERKSRIMLPEDDEDEIYAGDYFPRRFPSQTLSIEYLNVYTSQSTKSNMVLIAGITETKTEAELLVKKIKQTSPKTFLIQSRLYIGCLH